MKFRTTILATTASVTLLGLGNSQPVYANSTTSSQVENLKSELIKAKREYEQAKSVYENALSSAPSNTITLSDKYIKALKTAFSDFNISQTERDGAKSILQSESLRLKNQNSFHKDVADEGERLDVNNLPLTVRRELSFFAQDLINQVRSQVGTPSVSVSSSAIDFADKVAKEYVKDDWGLSKLSTLGVSGHNAEGINRVAKTYGLPTSDAESEKRGGQLYENLFFRPVALREATKSQLKEAIYTGMVEFMLNDTEWGHAQAIAGLNWGNPSSKDYFGLSFSSLSSVNSAHFITISQENINRATKSNFSTASVTDPRSSNRYQAVKKLEIDYKNKEKIYQDLKSKLENQTGKSTVEENNSKKAEPTKSIENTSDLRDQWKQEGSYWYYFDRAGKALVNSWKGNYYLKSNGVMARNEWVYDTNYKAWYYLKSDGSYAQNSWQGSYYLKSDGKMAQSEWLYDSSYKAWYYLKSDGSYAQNSWQGSYYLKSDGKMAQSEWQYDSSYKAWYYLKSDGSYAQNSWQGSYYLKSDGKMAQSEWLYDSSYKAWYYLKSDGSYLRDQWFKDGSAWYYLKADGKMAQNETIGAYYLDYSGKWIS
ncbi:SEC10/PgrA surface exclusion domain-containing protein [Streptococcus pneumoniae]|uniref:SEC10/PgrA surface exclusion domain-containing protein n=1 Tax=Streptococcus pneumoniae TaxID=1313 RepID=UPI0005E5DA45|nr:SEC10/PgrA surface exclusion domain-containing protein [Streptococcus pneumoniae]CJU61959.1 choline binding protein [Streptococcus pneumoniae]CKG59827.1 choline binding protein [Streptococcus pneumoniae]